MSLAILSSYALFGLQAKPVQVEVHVGPGLPAFNIVGLPGAGVRESRERVRAAILCSGFEFPAGRITANLAPADLPKDSGRFDLAIALGVLLASDQIESAQANSIDLKNTVLVGELSLTGDLLANDAALVIALSLVQEKPAATLIMASKDAQTAAMVPGVTVLQANSLIDVVCHMRGAQQLQLARPLELKVQAQSNDNLCLSDVRGQYLARLALEVAAAGGHSMLMNGPPGVGKSMLAQRITGILPDLSATAVLESAAIYSLTGNLNNLPTRPPFRAPHHGASMPALVGGGARPRPGEISLAHRGVLFLDELPEFERRCLESLREPLETGHITVARSSGSCQFPAQFQLLAAMNPCPCGWHKHPKNRCTCTDAQVQRYKGKISGPLLDRIDIYVVFSVEQSWLDLQPGETSAVVSARVIKARELQLKRQGCLNSELNARQLKQYVKMAQPAQEMLNQMVQKWGWSARSTQRCLRLAMTMSDLAGSASIGLDHLAAASQFRFTQQHDLDI